MNRDFAIAPPGKAARVSIVALIAVLPLLALGLPLLVGLGGKTQPLAIWLPAFIGAAMIVLAGLLWFGLHRMRVRLDAGRLEVRASGYRRRVAVADLDLDAARILPLDASGDWRPGFRSNGIGLPGVMVGHFRGRAWSRRVFCAVTDASPVLLLPERGGKRALMLSVQQPQALLDALRLG